MIRLKPWRHCNRFNIFTRQLDAVIRSPLFPIVRGADGRNHVARTIDDVNQVVTARDIFIAFVRSCWRGGMPHPNPGSLLHHYQIRHRLGGYREFLFKRGRGLEYFP